jgi:hypothetical protein
VLKNTEKYTLVGSPASLLEQLDKIQHEDKLAESKAGKSCGLGCLGLLVSWVFPVMVVPGDAATSVTALGSMGALLGSWWYYRRWKQHDLDDAKLAVARRLLEVLRFDLRDTVQAHLTLDFREAHQGPFVTRTVGIKKYYRQTWLELSTVFADSTRCELQVTRQGRYREKIKRRGNKIRHVRADRISVSLRVDPARYPDLSGVVLGDPPQDLKGRGVRAGQSRLTAAAITPASTYDNARGVADSPENLANPARILGALAWAYRGMKVVKTATAGAES